MYNWCCFVLLLILHSCVEQEGQGVKKIIVESATESTTIDIDSLYAKLSKGYHVNYKEVIGQFNYINNDEKSGRYIAKFMGGYAGKDIFYTSYGSDINDTITWGSASIKIKSKIDPTSITVYEIETKSRRFAVLVGKGQSASGSGQQVTFFVLLELNVKGILLTTNEFQSRFGNINSLLDFDRNGDLDYIKIVNSGNRDEYLLTVNVINTDHNVGKGMLLFKYLLDDKLVIIENTLVD